MSINHRFLVRCASVLVAVALLAGGGANLAGLPPLHRSFAELGLPVWFGYLIGALEVAAAIGLLVRRLSAIAAVVVVIIMVGAVYYHVVMGHALEGLPAFAILVCCVYIAMQRRSSTR